MRTQTRPLLWALALTFLALPSLALAYVGPGLGTGVIASVLGTIAGIFMLMFGAIWYPLKRLWRYVRQKSERAVIE